MNNRLSTRALLLLLIAIGLIGWIAGHYLHAHSEHAEKSEAEKGGEEEEEASDRIKVGRDEQDRTVVTANVEAQNRMGLVIAPLAAGTYQPYVKAWGQLEEDPAHTFTLRAPVPGFLEVKEPARWPHIGEHLSAGAAVGVLAPRFTPVEHYDLTTRVLQSRAEVDEAEAELSAARTSYESKKALNAGQNVVAQRTLEEAEAKVKSTEARVAGAKQIVQVLEDALAGKRAETTTIPLTIDRAGDVVDVTAQPGEAVESGQSLIKVVALSHLVARVGTAAGVMVSAAPQKARLLVMGLDSQMFAGAVLGSIPATNIRGQTFLVALENPRSILRPGAAIEATLELPGEPMQGVIVPASAVIRLGGSAYVYLQSAEEVFTRVVIKTDAPAPEGWFVNVGLAPGDRVIDTGAGILLSEELRSQIEAEAGGEGEGEEKDKEKEKD